MAPGATVTMATVLIIDDDPDMRLILDRVLRHAGHATLTAANGLDAREVVRHGCPDVAFVDIFMPEMDGIDTITELRRTCAETRIVAMSAGWNVGPFIGAEGDWRDVLKVARKLGADRALQKPIDPDVVCQQVEELLAEGRRPSTPPVTPPPTEPPSQGAFTMPVSEAQRAWIRAQPTAELSRLAEQLVTQVASSSGPTRVERHNRLDAVLEEIEARRRGERSEP